MNISTQSFTGSVIKSWDELQNHELFPGDDRKPIQFGLTAQEVVVSFNGQTYTLQPTEFAGDKGNATAQDKFETIITRDDAHALLHGLRRNGGLVGITPPNPSEYRVPLPGRTVGFGIGLTYAASIDTRNEEAQLGERIQRPEEKPRPGKRFYDFAGDPENPEEVFQKFAYPKGYVTTEAIRIRPDAPVKGEGLVNTSLPEPELAFFMTPDGRIVAMGFGSDTTACLWEATNPLYLPRAKTYANSTTVHNLLTIVPPDQDLPNMAISMKIERGGEEIFYGTTSTEQFKRSIGDMVSGVFALEPEGGFIQGSFLMTGTGIVPKGITLEDGDTVTITTPMGVMSVPVKNIEYRRPSAAWTPREVAGDFGTERKEQERATLSTPPAFDVAGRRVIVTGGAGGIGRAVVEDLLKGGARVAVADFNAHLGEKVLGELKEQYGDNVIFVPLNVTKKRSCVDCAKTVAEKWGGVDALANVAGINAPGSIETVSATTLSRINKVNVNGVVLMTQAVVPYMKPKGRHENDPAPWIINIESIVSRLAIPNRAAYNASKGGVRGVTDASVADLTKYGIGIVGIQPGRVRTEMAEKLIAGHQNPAWYATVMKGSQYTNEMTEPDEVAKMVHAIIGGNMRNLTGAHITLDGGWTAVGPNEEVMSRGAYEELELLRAAAQKQKEAATS